MCEAIYIGNTQQTFKKILGRHLYNLLNLLKNGQKSYSFAADFKQHFNTTTSHTDLRNYMTFKLVKQINPVGVMKTFMKPNCNLCMEERLKIRKQPRDKRVTIKNNDLRYTGPVGTRQLFFDFD